jgi:hypothetical protein
METMKIYSGQYKGFDTAEQIQEVINRFKDLIHQHANRVNGAALKASKMTTQYPWLEKASGEGFEFDERTKEQIDSEKAEEIRIEIESEYNQKLVAAKTDSELAKQLKDAFMAENGYPKTELAFQLSRRDLGEITEDEFLAFNDGRLAKLQEIIDKISNAIL